MSKKEEVKQTLAETFEKLDLKMMVFCSVLAICRPEVFYSVKAFVSEMTYLFSQLN